MSFDIQFVDSISATATVRLNLDFAPWSTQLGTRFDPPPMRYAVASTLLTDGEHIPAAAYGDRTLALRLRLLDVTEDQAAAQLQLLFRELNRPTNFLRYRPGTTEPVWFRTKRCSADEVTFDPIERTVSVDVPAEPFAYGLKESPFPQPLVIADSFTRTVTGGWGSAPTGQPWTVVVGAAAAFSVGLNVGTIAPTVLAADHIVAVDLGSPDQDVKVLMETNTAPVGGAVRYGLAGRITDASNHYRFVAVVAVGGAITLEIDARVAGVVTTLASVATGMTNATNNVIRYRCIGSRVQLKIWDFAGSEPAAWNFDTTDTTVPLGTLGGCFARRETGNTAPTTLDFDLFSATTIPVYVKNDPAAAGGMFVDITGVKGDVETPMILRADQADVNGLTGTAIGIRRRGTVADVPFASQAEVWTLLTDTTLQANDPTASGAGSNYVRCSFATNAALVDRMTIAFPPVPSPAARGLYRVFARCRNTVGISSILSLRLSGSPTALALLGTGWSWGHLGYVAVPGGTDQAADFAGQPLDPGQVQLTVQAERLSGAASLDIDCLVFVPADDGHALVAWSSHGATGWTVLDGTTDLAYALDSAGRIVPSTPPPSYAGGIAMLTPATTNRLYLVKRAFALSGVDTLTEAVRLDLSYYPRYLYARQATE